MNVSLLATALLGAALVAGPAWAKLPALSDEAKALAAADVGWHPLGGPYAVGPGRVRTRTGDPFQVFTPFARAWREHGWRPPVPRPTGLRLHAADTENLPATTDHPSLPVTEDQAAAAWREFTQDALATYAAPTSTAPRPCPWR